MQIVLDCVKRIVGVGLFALLLGACAAPPAPVEGSLMTGDARSTPEAAPTPTPTTPLRTLAATSTPRPTVEGFTPITTTPVAASLAPLHALRLEKQRTSQLALDGTYLYWVANEDRRHIFRYPLAGGEVETLTSTLFEDGELAILAPSRSGDWLIFLDTPFPVHSPTWALRALNLRDGAEQVVLEETGDSTSWPGPFVDADGDWIAWTRTGQSEDAGCVETVLAMRNLRSGEQRELERSCVEDRHMWVFPRLSGGRLVVEQDLPDSKGSGNNIYLYDLTSGERTALTDNDRSSIPDISGPWIVWKGGRRFYYGRATVLYDLRSGQRFKIRHEERLAGRLAGRWLYWQPSVLKPLYVYDLEAEQMLLVATPGANETIKGVAIYDNTIAWCRDLDFEHSAPHDTLLEWRTLP